MAWENGSCYKGQIFNGTMEGIGTMENKGWKYVGQWVNGEMHGAGQIFCPDGSSVKCSFVSGSMFGEGFYLTRAKIKYRIIAAGRDIMPQSNYGCGSMIGTTLIYSEIFGCITFYIGLLIMIYLIISMNTIAYALVSVLGFHYLCIIGL
jgi:MORN repeat